VKKENQKGEKTIVGKGIKQGEKEMSKKGNGGEKKGLCHLRREKGMALWKRDEPGVLKKGRERRHLILKKGKKGKMRKKKQA